MTQDQLMDRIRELLLPELRTGELEWYYISTARPKQFVGGFLIQARGPTEAWTLLHQLGWCEKDCETLTNGPIDPEIMEKIPEENRWRRLDRTEIENLGK